MPCWYFDRSELQSTPSSRSGVDAAVEEKYRREGAKLIIDAGSALELRYDVCATGAVYFHRFYMFHSFTDFHRYVVGSSCLFLAAKIDESNVTCDAVINAIQTLLTPTQFSVFGKDPKQEILITEKVLVEGLRFDLLIDLPYPHLLKFIKLLQGKSETIEQLLKMSWTFINDSLCTTLPVEWEPDLIAISLLYLSCRLTKFKVDSWVDKPQGYTGKWYKFFVSDVTLDIIENVCRQILDLYAGRGSGVPKQQQKSLPGKASLSRSPPRTTRTSMSISPLRQKSVDRDQYRSRSRRSSSRSPKRRGDDGVYTPRFRTGRSPNTRRIDAVYACPLGSGNMLTPEEFERLQHTVRMESAVPANHTFTPAPPQHFAHSIPVAQPPHLVYQAPFATPVQHLPPPATVMLTPQPMMMPAPLNEQPRPFPGMEPTRLLPPPVYHEPRLGVPPQFPVAQPLPPGISALPPPGVFYR